MNVPPSRRTAIRLATPRPGIFERGGHYIAKLAYASSLTIGADAPADATGMVSAVSGDTRVFIPMAELVDLDRERERLNKERERLTAEVARVDGKLSNEGFLSKAPEALVAGEREKREKFAAMLAKVEVELSGL